MSDQSLDAAIQPDRSNGTAFVVNATPGAQLSAARQREGLTVEQVASQLNLAPRQVAALEADDYAALPGMVIVRGFLRSYAKLLRIDPVPLLEMLADTTPAAGSAPVRRVAASTFSQSRMPAMHSNAKSQSKGPAVALLAVVLVAAGASYVLGWWPDVLTRRISQMRPAVMTGGSESTDAVNASDAARAADAGSTTGSTSGIAAGGGPSDRSIAVDAATGQPIAAGEPGLTSTSTLSKPSATSPATTTSGPATAPAANTVTPRPPAPAPATAPGPAGGKVAPRAGAGVAANPLVLHVQQDSWVEIKRKNNTAMVARMIKAGSVETFDIDQPVTLIVGNISGVAASLRGAPLALDAGAKGNVSKLRIE